TPARFGRQLALEIADGVDRGLDLQLDPGRERPIGQAESARHPVERGVDRQRQSIAAVAEHGERLRALDDDIEGVAVGDEIALAVARHMYGILDDLDALEAAGGEAAQEFVVIAGNIDDARPRSRAFEEMAHDGAIGFRPAPAFAQAPAVDDVAD